MDTEGTGGNLVPQFPLWAACRRWGVSTAAPDCWVLWHQEVDLRVQNSRGSVLGLEAT